MSIATAFFSVGALVVGAVTAQPETAIIIALGALMLDSLREIFKTERKEKQ